MGKISIILPTFNEEGNIQALINKISKLIKNYPHEIIVVDDNSVDDTQGKVKELKNKNVKLLIRTKDRSLAKSILTGINTSTGKIIIVMDTDFNHDPTLIPQMIEYLKHYNMIIGSRFVYAGGMDDSKREIYSYLFNLFLKILLKTRVHDNLSGYFAIRKENLLKLPLRAIFKGYGDYFIRLIFFAKMENLTILEIPVWYKIRTQGQSKSRFTSMIIAYTKTSLSLKFSNKKEHNQY